MVTISQPMDYWKIITGEKCIVCGKKIKRPKYHCSPGCINKAMDNVDWDFNPVEKETRHK